MTALPTLPDSVRGWAASRPDHAAVICGDTLVSYAALAQRGARTASALAAAGVGPGCRVAHLAHDSERYVDLLLGCAEIGAVLVPIDWRLTAPEVEQVLQDSGAELLCQEPGMTDLVTALRPRLPALRRAIILDADGFDAWRDAHPVGSHGFQPDQDTPLVQMYTSGTTGTPKGVVLAQRTFFAVAALLAEHELDWIDWRADDRNLVGAPGFHIGGIWWAVQGLNAGVTNILVPAFDSQQVARLISELAVTTACMVPAMLRAIMDVSSVAPAGLRSLRKIVYGGSPIPETLLRRCMDSFDADLVQIYGLTETGNTAVCLPAAQHRLGDPRLVAAGRPYPGVDLRVVDDSGTEVPAGEVGEVHLRTPARMVEYWNRPEQTADTLVDGWVHTGDAGYVDADGFLYIRDRIKDMIIVGGENVYPAEVENALCRHPAVHDAAVVGAPDPVLGEQVCAYVVPAPGLDVPAAELRQFLRGELARYKIPATIRIVDSVPRNASGKILRRTLRDQLWTEGTRQVVMDEEPTLTVATVAADTRTPKTDTEHVIANIWAEVLGQDSIEPTDDFFDLGGHSLLGMSVITRVIAAFGLTVSIEDLFDKPTVASLAAEVERLLEAEIALLSDDEVAAALDTGGARS
jgi:long-chain acyl-CoA synthetase